MMNNNPIGIFDSGIGGLSVLEEIQRRLPNENLIYIADSAYAPYGNKPQDFILQRCEVLTRFLLKQQVKAIVIACNTATAVAVAKLREEFTIPIIAMEPGVKPAIAATKTGTVGVMATQNTLASEQFTRLVHRYSENVSVINQPCPGLVEEIETGKFESAEIYKLVERYSHNLLTAGADTIVLGCTHYPLIKKQIAEVVGSAIAIIETGQAVALQVQRILTTRNLLNDGNQQNGLTCWGSGDSDTLQTITTGLFSQVVPVHKLPDSNQIAEVVPLSRQ